MQIVYFRLSTVDSWGQKKMEEEILLGLKRIVGWRGSWTVAGGGGCWVLECWVLGVGCWVLGVGCVRGGLRGLRWFELWVLVMCETSMKGGGDHPICVVRMSSF
jgi:hypothetical protein